VNAGTQHFRIPHSKDQLSWLIKCGQPKHFTDIKIVTNHNYQENA